MATLIVPPLDEAPWPTLGKLVCDFIEERAIFGPGDLQGQSARLSSEKRGIIYRAYEVYPRGSVDRRGNDISGRRRFPRVGWSVRKGLAKTELLGWVTYAELHPEGPVRCDGFDARGRPVGRPVASPYIPMLAYNKEQVEELAFGVLSAVCAEGPDADLFDVSQERVARLNDLGREDGKAVPLAQSPNARDGARTTFQAFDEPHRMYLPRIRDAHETMNNNLPKRPAADAWSFYVGTAGQLGQESIAEDLYVEAQEIAAGKRPEARLFFFHRDAGQVHRGDEDARGHDLTDDDQRIEAIAEATGPEGEWGPGQFEAISELYTRPKTDRGYWERVQLNLWIQGDRQAFDPIRCRELVRPGETIPLGAWVTAGFDGARFRDSTAIVITEIDTGMQQIHALWERPDDLADDEEWEVDPLEVDAAVDQLFWNYDVFRWNGDPPHWLESHANWSARHPQVEEWFTHRTRQMAFALRNYVEAITEGSVGYADLQAAAIGSAYPDETLGAALLRHLASAGKHELNLYDDEGKQMFILEKLRDGQVFDAGMAAVLSWEARLVALTEPQQSSGVVRRLH